ncbi:MAG: polysaccharide biosynthesis protein [Phycisphaerales bacterium JB040]
MRTLLIAAQGTIASLRAQLQCAERVPNVAGELVLRDANDIERLDEVCREHRIERAVVSLPSGMLSERLAIRAALRRLGVLERAVTPIDEMLGAEPGPIRTGSGGQAPDLGALIGREPRTIDRGLVEGAIAGRTVLVTGAGGSIGSELVRTIAGFGPERLVLMERSENALFEIDRALAGRFPGLERVAILHDVVDAERTLELCERYRPGVVLHAAAHKHVPLMEDHPAHALNNNVFGTVSIASAAAAVGAERFVLISTDKAVHPSSVMGATKRLAERYVQGLAASGSGPTRCCMVRFGNVLGSNGSVLTVWGHQIDEGGPITLTDRRMTRYFMTIPEAASLVLQAGAMSGEGARSGEVFVLDMGRPVAIADLAERFVRSCGFEPAWDGEARNASEMPIVVSGVRPGEKLHEQLVYDDEELSETPHPGIRRFIDPEEPDPGVLERMVADLGEARGATDTQAVLDAIARWIPEWGEGRERGGACERGGRASELKPVPAHEAA